MSVKTTKICVIGAEIIGMTSAVVLIKNIPNIEITLISDKFTPNTTGDGSAGHIYPYMTGSTDPTRVRRWVRDTMSYLRDHLVSENAGKLGIGLMSVYMLFDEQRGEVYERSDCDEEMISCRDMTAQEMNLFPKKWTKGVFVTTYYPECTKLLPFLMQEFKSKGGTIVQKRVNDIKELCGKYDIVINCTGVEANKLCGDSKVYPIRGQVYRVIAPWIRHGVIAGYHYILPNNDSVVLGGTHQDYNSSREVDTKDGDDIMKGCAQLVPSVKTAQVLKQWVGLRPARESVRLKTEVVTSLGKKLHVVHNYGHGGSGVTLSYGCAREVLHNVNQILSTNMYSQL